ncbi:hypothetical protein [Nocardia australiensis]|nr:hypothetical protein [Nocardia australiensis]
MSIPRPVRTRRRFASALPCAAVDAATAAGAGVAAADPAATPTDVAA